MPDFVTLRAITLVRAVGPPDDLAWLVMLQDARHRFRVVDGAAVGEKGCGARFSFALITN
jgi:hypothetical protein